MLASIDHCTARSVLRALVMERTIWRDRGGLQGRFYDGMRLRKMFFSISGITMVWASGPHPQKYLERDGMVAIGQIKGGWLGVERHIRAQPQLPRAVLDYVPHPANRVGPDSIGRMHRRLRM